MRKFQGFRAEGLSGESAAIFQRFHADRQRPSPREIPENIFNAKAPGRKGVGYQRPLSIVHCSVAIWDAGPTDGQ